MAKGVEEVALVFIIVQAAQQAAFAIDILATNIVTGGDKVGAQIFGGKLEEGFEFDLFVAENIRVRRASGFVLFQEVLKDVIPVLGSKVYRMQVDT